jgi:hypothetical protein
VASELIVRSAVSLSIGDVVTLDGFYSGCWEVIGSGTTSYVATVVLGPFDDCTDCQNSAGT